MNKFDIVEKINIVDAVKAFAFKSLGLKKLTPYQVLSKELELKEDWQGSYFNWGRNALYYFFKSLEFDTIAFPAFTCPTLTQAAEKAGKKVYLIEADPETFNLDITKIPQSIKCLVAVHTFGNPLDIEKIRKRVKDIFIIEDCAHSLFSRINKQLVGTKGDAVLFSLYKQIANLNGSLLLYKDKVNLNQKKESELKYLKRLIFKLQGPHQFLLNKKRQNYLPGIKPEPLTSIQPSDLVCSLFSLGLEGLQKEVLKREKIAEFYFKQANKSPYFTAQKVSLNANHSFYHFAIRLDPKLVFLRDRLVLTLRREHIFPARLWPDAPVAQKKYQKFVKACPKALMLARTVINLPISSRLTKKDVEYLFARLNKTVTSLKKSEK